MFKKLLISVLGALSLAACSSGDSTTKNITQTSEKTTMQTIQLDTRVASWDGWLNYNAQLSADKLTQPTLMVASEAMALPEGAHMYLDNAGSNVNAVWLDGISQFNFYDQPEAVKKAVDAISKHFEVNL